MKCFLLLTFLAFAVCDATFSLSFFLSKNGEQSKKVKTFTALPSEVTVVDTNTVNGVLSQGHFKVYIEEDMLYDDGDVRKTDGKVGDCFVSESDVRSYYLYDMCSLKCTSTETETGKCIKYDLEIGALKYTTQGCKVDADDKEAKMICTFGKDGKNSYTFNRLFATSAKTVNIYGEHEFNKLKDIAPETDDTNTRVDGGDDTADDEEKEKDDKIIYNFKKLNEKLAYTDDISKNAQDVLKFASEYSQAKGTDSKGDSYNVALYKVGATIYRCDVDKENRIKKIHVCTYDGTDIYCKDQVFSFSLKRGISIACLVIVALISILF